MRLSPASAGSGAPPPHQTCFDPKGKKKKEVIMTTTAKRSRPRHLSVRYFQLVKRHPLKSIRTEAQLDAAQAVIDALLARRLDDGERAYLDALSDLVIVYEQEHHAIAELEPNEMLQQLLLDRGISQADLVRKTGLAKATVSDLAAGKRAFTVEQMYTLAAAFGVPAIVFMPGYHKD
jgi:HTH-type transcriptional regulator / antitoxin HigA